MKAESELLAEVLRVIEGDERTRLPRHRHRLSREEVETAQRARVIVATAEVVTGAGYAAATTRAIIERAGVSSRTFYQPYGDLESAFLDAYTLLDGVVIAAARAPIRVGDPATSTMRAGAVGTAHWRTCATTDRRSARRSSSTPATATTTRRPTTGRLSTPTRRTPIGSAAPS